MNHRKAFEYCGYIAGAVLILFGAVAIYMGADGRSTVRDSLEQEKIVFGDAADSPRLGPVERLFLVRTVVHQRRQLVEREHDVRAELVLDLHRHLGGEAVA